MAAPKVPLAMFEFAMLHLDRLFPQAKLTPPFQDKDMNTYVLPLQVEAWVPTGAKQMIEINPRQRSEAFGPSIVAVWLGVGPATFRAHNEWTNQTRTLQMQPQEAILIAGDARKAWTCEFSAPASGSSVMLIYRTLYKARKLEIDHEKIAAIRAGLKKECANNKYCACKACDVAYRDGKPPEADVEEMEE